MVSMDKTQAETDQAPETEAVENEAARQGRHAWEAQGVAKARASIAAGYYVTEAEVDAWIDSLATDRPLPAPYPPGPRPL